MLNATDLKNGVIFMHEDAPYKVLNYAHIKMARGGAVIKLKAQHILTGAIKDISINNGDRVEQADVINKNMQYLYSDDDDAYFMDNEDYSQTQINLKEIENEAKYLTEGKEFQVTFFQDNPISVVVPVGMYMKVAEADPAVKGNTSTGASKKVRLENGLEIDAPLFIKPGDVVKINTTTGQYVERGSSDK